MKRGMLFGAIVLVIAAACGGGGDSGDTEPTSAERDGPQPAVVVTASKVKFQPEVIRVASGVPFQLRLENLDPFEHDLQVAGLEVDVVDDGGLGHRPEGQAHGGGEKPVLALHVKAKETMTGTFVAHDRGTYDFWCTLPGHKDQGMVGQITIE